MVGLPIVNRRIEINKAQEAIPRLPWPEWTRRFIRGASRRCKVRFSQGDIIDSAVDAETGQPEEADTGQPRNWDSGQLESRGIGARWETQDLGQPGNWSIVVAEGKMSGATWRFNRGEPSGAWSGVTRISINRCRRIRRSGRLGQRIVGDTEGLELGATWGPVSRHRRMMRASGQLDDRSPVKPEMQDKGRPESFIAGAAGEGGSTGATRETRWNRQRQRHARSGQLERTIAGTAEGSKPRGNPRIRTPAQQKGSGEGAT